VTDLLNQLRVALAGRYRIERELGRGGMATVYLARDLKHKRPVALKVLGPNLSHSLGIERFLREIETAAGLQHPHILPLHDSGEVAGLLWYTMPYVEGESLRDRLTREPQLPIEEALGIAREVADALTYAHGRGVVHRDVKPENILLSGGHALVADFGVAKALDQASAGHLTETGMAVGTPQYMAPEQAGGGAVDARADVYALGCVLYEMLAGEPPYTGTTPQAILAKRVLESVPHVRTLRESVPEGVEHAITRALAKMPADRFQTATEFARALAVSAVTPAAGGVPAAATTPGATATMTAPPKPIGWRRMPAGVTALAVGLLLALGVLFAWLRTRPAAEPAGPRRVAVLPFENLGGPENEYFADGLTDAVRGKLTSLPGLQVTARGSSSQYKKTTKSPREIGRELGVDYILSGTVRWQQGGSGQGRVQVSPELVQVATAAAKWQAPFEAPLTDVFQVQGQIAGQVAQALGVALGADEREQLAERPTQNLAAYDAFLRGEQAAEGLGTQDPVALRRAIDYYERAVALDSGFALASAQLSRAYSLDYWGAPTSAAAALARHGAERGRALAPKQPEGYLALGDYYANVQHEYARALEQYTRGQELAPKDARLLTAVAASKMSLGQFEEGLAQLRAGEVLDPRSIPTATYVAYTLLYLRRPAEAIAAADRALTLAPANLSAIHAKAMVHLAKGDLTGAQAVLQAVPREVDPAALVAYMATTSDLYWVLDDAQQRLVLRLSPAPFDNNRAYWALCLAEIHALRGDSALARAYADSSRLDYDARLRDVPEAAMTHAFFGVALAYLGRKAEAIREGERGVALMPIGRDANGAYLQHALAWIYILVGEPERALDRLEPLLKIPYYLTPAWLKIDPRFAPLRGNPRFEQLVNGS